MQLTDDLSVDLAGTAYLIQPVVFTWANKLLSRDGDDAARAVTLFAMNGKRRNIFQAINQANRIIGASSVLYSFWGVALYPATDAATVSLNNDLPPTLPNSELTLLFQQGFHKGTITMVVVSVSLAGWIGLVWWQDRRTAHIQVIHQRPGEKLEEDVEMQVQTLPNEIGTVKN